MRLLFHASILRLSGLTRGMKASIRELETLTARLANISSFDQFSDLCFLKKDVKRVEIFKNVRGI